MKCTGIDAIGGVWLELSGGAVLQSVEPLVTPGDGATYLAPGFIDIQVNGFAGADYCSPETPLELIEHSLNVQFSTGVTRLLATVITGGPDAMLGALRNLARARATLRHGRAMEGFHVEGPHISPNDGPRGAHPRPQVRPPDVEEYKRWQDAAEGRVKLVTLSPEWPQAPAYIEYLVRDGVTVSIGHLDATEAQIDDAVRAGATLSTHLGNGAHKTLPRHPNYLWQQLAEDRLNASFIADGIHLDGRFLTVALRAKGLERAVLVTDAVMPAGCEPGPYMLGEVEVQLHAAASESGCQRVTLRDGDRLAGSALRMDRGIEFLMKLAGLSLAEAVTLATRNPARVARIPHRQRGLQPGERADVVEFEYDKSGPSIRVLRTWLDGELVYSR
ncbi:MAG: amidohydrolase family protein [Candidatus Solibacter usitatus]|nr:amidohydrolase family protein [Candidatus Solibacter usitatus]